MTLRYVNTVTQVLRLLTEFFKDEHKVDTWLRVPNPLLGGITPLEMLQSGRATRLLRMIKAHIEENNR